MNTTKDYLAGIAIAWEGTTIGFTPYISEGETEAAHLVETKPIDDLIDALSDKDLFISAHVLLTRISGVEYQAFPTWNGLVIDITPDGRVLIAQDQRLDLATRWQRWQQAKPKPNILPA